MAVESKWAYLGDIFGISWRNVFSKRFIGEPCTSCFCFNFFCGDRCLYAYYERFWGNVGFNKIYSLIRFMIDELRRIADRVRVLMLSDVFDSNLLIYPPFNNTTELIP